MVILIIGIYIGIINQLNWVYYTLIGLFSLINLINKIISDIRLAVLLQYLINNKESKDKEDVITSEIPNNIKIEGNINNSNCL